MVKWINRYRKLIIISDRSSILLVVYVAFSEAVIEGIWNKVDGWSLLMIVICCFVKAEALIVLIFPNILSFLLFISKVNKSQ